MNIISTNKAQMIASYWHDGLHSALYQFASSKVFLNENYGRYIAEIERCGDGVKELDELGKYFTYKYMNE
jgi:hypothetical protein